MTEIRICVDEEKQDVTVFVDDDLYAYDKLPMPNSKVLVALDPSEQQVLLIAGDLEIERFDGALVARRKE